VLVEDLTCHGRFVLALVWLGLLLLLTFQKLIHDITVLCLSTMTATGSIQNKHKFVDAIFDLVEGPIVDIGPIYPLLTEYFRELILIVAFIDNILHDILLFASFF